MTTAHPGAEPAARPAAPDYYQALLYQMPQAFCVIEVLFDAANQAQDFRFLEINHLFEQQTGLADAAGKLGSELVPGTERHWLDTYGQVIATGQSVRFENYHHDTGHWYEAYAMRLGEAGSRRVAIIFEDITRRKRRTAGQALLAEVARELAALTDRAETVQRLGAKIGRHFGVQQCLFVELSADYETSQASGWNASGASMLAGMYRMRDFWSEEQLEANKRGTLSIVDDTQADPRVSAASYGALGIHSFVSVPLVRAGQWRFMLSILDAKPRHWHPDEVNLLYDLANHIWTRLERARAEEALRASEQKFRTLANTAPAFIWHNDEQGANQFVNQSFLDYIGHSEESVQGEAWHGLMHPADAPAYIASYLEAVQAQRPWQHRNRIRRHDGAWHWYENYAQPLLGPDGRFLGHVGVSTDINASVLAEQRQALLLKLSDALRSHSDPLDLQRAAMQLLAEQLDVMRASYLEVEADGDTFTLLASYEQGGAPVPGPLRFSDFGPGISAAYRAGHTLAFRDTELDTHLGSVPAAYRPLGIRAWAAVPLVRQGRLLTIVGVHSATPRDWTSAELQLLADVAERTWAAIERTRAETALRQSEARLHLALEAAELGTWEWDVATRQVRASARNLAMLGLTPTPEPRAPADFLQFVHPADRPGVLRRLQAAIDSACVFEAEFRVAAGQGPERWLSSHGQATSRAPDGRAQCLSGVMLDITARKQLEEADKLRLRLQQQQQLVATVLTAQEEERRRISESLHNGLGQLLYAAKLQLDRLPVLPDQPAYQEATRLLGDSIVQARTLSHELTPALLADFGLAVALSTICQQLSTPTLRWHCHLELDEAAALPLALQQAVYRLAQGLAHNVAKHAEATEATLEAETLPDWLVLRVEDNGQGFDPATVTEGLGLKTLRSRVALLGGILKLDSAPRHGTQIQVRLPVG